MQQKRQVFISYYHDEDQQYKNKFKRLFADHYEILESRSIEHGDIDPDDNQKVDYITQQIRDRFIHNATVIVVLIGEHTWQRMFVDREIYSGLRKTKTNGRCGLLGILLPTYPGYKNNEYYHNTIPPRLYDNLKDGVKFAKIYTWTEKPKDVRGWIETAHRRRNGKPYPVFRNRPILREDLVGPQWYG